MTAGLLELGEIMIVGAHRRLESISQNVANLTTTGYRRTASFQQTMNVGAASDHVPTDFAHGALRATGRTFDIALASDGFFAVRGEDGAYYTRDGQFTRDPQGRLINEQGFALQSADGGDVTVSAAAIEILEDGTVLDDGVPVSRVGVFALAPEARLNRVTGSYFQTSAEAMVEVETPLVRLSDPRHR
jgi:flagellar basal body rod protein FlgG